MVHLPGQREQRRKVFRVTIQRICNAHTPSVPLYYLYLYLYEYTPPHPLQFLCSNLSTLWCLGQQGEVPCLCFLQVQVLGVTAPLKPFNRLQWTPNRGPHERWSRGVIEILVLADVDLEASFVSLVVWSSGPFLSTNYCTGIVQVISRK
jgi:hypothetical protein